MEKLTINGETFEVIRTRKHIVKPFRGWFCDESAIFNAYERPSIYKIEIWKSWLKWARETEGVKAFEITSHNCMQFTIGGLYVDESGKEYNIYITKCYNKLYPVTE